MLIDRSARICEFSRERLRESDDALLAASEWLPRAIRLTPARIPLTSIRYVLLLVGGTLRVEECPSGQEYAFARNVNAGIIGIYESEGDAEVQMKER